MKRKLSILLILSIYSVLCVAQAHKIFRDNNVNYLKIDTTYFSANVYLKDTLPDGIWIYYDCKTSDSLKKNIDQYIKTIGKYKDSLKDGTFRHFMRCNFGRNGRKTKRVEAMTYNYKKGKLDGYYFNRDCSGHIVSTGFYKSGKKDGFFIDYNRNNEVSSIHFFANDTLKQWVNYYPDGIIKSQGNGDVANRNGKCIKYDTLGNKTYVGLYKNGQLLEYKEYYSNGHIKKQAKGVFVSPDKTVNNQPYAVLGTPQENKEILNHSIASGNVIYYSEKGVVTKKEAYKNGKLLK